MGNKAIKNPVPSPSSRADTRDIPPQPNAINGRADTLKKNGGEKERTLRDVSLKFPYEQRSIKDNSKMLIGSFPDVRIENMNFDEEASHGIEFKALDSHIEDPNINERHSRKHSRIASLAPSQAKSALLNRGKRKNTKQKSTSRFFTGSPDNMQTLNGLDQDDSNINGRLGRRSTKLSRKSVIEEFNFLRDLNRDGQGFSQFDDANSSRISSHTQHTTKEASGIHKVTLYAMMQIMSVNDFNWLKSSTLISTKKDLLRESANEYLSLNELTRHTISMTSLYMYRLNEEPASAEDTTPYITTVFDLPSYIKLTEGKSYQLQQMKLGYLTSVSTNPKLAKFRDVLPVASNLNVINTSRIVNSKRSIEKWFELKCLTELDKIYLLVQKIGADSEDKDSGISLVCPNMSCVEYVGLNEIGLKVEDALWVEDQYLYSGYSFHRLRAPNKYISAKALSVRELEGSNVEPFFLLLNELSLYKKYLRSSRSCPQLLQVLDLLVDYDSASPTKFPTFYMLYQDYHCSLRHIFEYRRANKHYFTIPEAMYLLSDITKGMKALHTLDISHRNIRPEAIFYNYETKLFMIGGLSLAAVSDSEAYIQLSALIGTPFYLSIDYFTDFLIKKRRVHFVCKLLKADIYSLGVLTCELLALTLGEKGVQPLKKLYSFLKTKKLQDIGDLIKLAEEKISFHEALLEIVLSFESTGRKDISSMVRGMLELDIERRVDTHWILDQLEQMGYLDIKDRPQPQVHSQASILPTSLELKKPKSKVSQTLQEGESIFLEDANVRAAKQFLRDKVIDYSKRTITNVDALNDCFHSAVVLSHLQRFSQSAQLLKRCEEYILRKGEGQLVATYVRVCFMRVSNLKILNKKEEALEVATGLTKYLLENKYWQLSTVADILALIANLLYLMNILGEAVKQLKHAQHILSRCETDDELDLKISNIDLLIAKIHFTLGNYITTASFLESRIDKPDYPNRTEFLLLRAEIFLASGDITETENNLMSLEKTLDKHKRSDSDSLIKVQVMFFLIAMSRSTPKMMAKYRDSCLSLIRARPTVKNLYTLLGATMQGMCKLETDQEESARFLQKATDCIDKLDQDPLSLKAFIFEMLITLIYESKYQPIHQEYIKKIFANVELQSCPQHICTLRMTLKHIQILEKTDQLEEAKALSLKIREMCKALEDKLENKLLLLEVWLVYPNLLATQGMIAQAKEEYNSSHDYLLEARRDGKKHVQIFQAMAQNKIDLICRSSTCRMDSLAGGEERAEEELKSLCENFKLKQSVDSEGVYFSVYRAYFSAFFRVARTQKNKLPPENIINSMIRLANNSKDPLLRARTFLILAEYHALTDNFRGCELHIDKCLHVVQTDPALVKRSEELVMEFSSRALKLLALYSSSFGDDDEQQKINALSKRMIIDIKTCMQNNRSNTASNFFYLKCKYRICRFLLLTSEIDKAIREFKLLIQEMSRLPFEAGYWLYWSRYYYSKAVFDYTDDCSTALETATDAVRDGKITFGPMSDQAIKAEELRLNIKKKIDYKNK